MAGQSCRPAVHLVVEHSALAGCGAPPCARCRAHRLDSWRGGADVTQRAGRTGRSVSTSRLLVTSASTLVTLVPPSLAQQPDVCNTAPQQGRVERSGGNRGIYGTRCAHVWQHLQRAGLHAGRDWQFSVARRQAVAAQCCLQVCIHVGCSSRQTGQRRCARRRRQRRPAGPGEGPAGDEPRPAGAAHCASQQTRRRHLRVTAGDTAMSPLGCAQGGASAGNRVRIVAG